jgi:hypothetical protein
MSSQHTDQKLAQFDTVCLPKLFIFQNCSVLTLQQSKLTELTPNLNLHWPKSQTMYQIKLLKVRNKLTKFGANPNTFEPPTTSLKIDRSDLRNLDRFTSSSSPLLTWLWCFSVFSHPFTATVTFLACSLTHSHQGVSRVFFLYLPRRHLNR